MKYVVNKYCGGTWCGNAYCETLDACYAFANDGFCDYMRITEMETGTVIKAHIF